MIVSRLLRTRRSGLAALSIVLMLAITSQRVSAAGLGCLDVPGYGQFNLDTGQDVQIRQQIKTHQTTSPDKSRLAYLTGAPNTPRMLLQVESTPDKVVTVRSLPYDGHQVPRIRWTADSQWIVYAWQDVDNKIYLGIADRNGVEHKTIIVSTEPQDSFSLGNLKDSPVLNNHYISLTVSQQPMLIIEIPTLTVHSFNNTTHFPTVSLSPDEKYVALAQVDELGTESGYHLNIFELSTNKLVTSVEHLVGDPPGREYGTKLDWSTDSRSLFFSQLMPNDKAHVQLMALRVESRQVDSLALVDVYKGVAFSPDRAYAVYTFEDDAHATVYLLDMRTGQKKALYTISALSTAVSPAPVDRTSLLFLLYTQWQRNATLILVQVWDQSGLHVLWMDEDGANLQRVDFLGEATDFDDGSNGSPPYHWENFSDSDSQRLIFSINEAFSSYNVWLLNLTTKSYRQLASGPDRENVFFSPDKRTLAYTALAYDASSDLVDRGNNALHLLALDTQTTRSIPLEAQILAMGWSPKGDMLIYQTNPNTLKIIWRDGRPIQTINAENSALSGISFNQHEIIWTTCQTPITN